MCVDCGTLVLQPMRGRPRPRCPEHLRKYRSGLAQARRERQRNLARMTALRDGDLIPTLDRKSAKLLSTLSLLDLRVQDTLEAGLSLQLVASHAESLEPELRDALTVVTNAILSLTRMNSLLKGQLEGR